jgi:hypothetical protein
MITGRAEVRWDLHQKAHGADKFTSDEFTSEAKARDAFDEACRDRSVAEAKLFMLVEIESASHFKASGKGR